MPSEALFPYPRRHLQRYFLRVVSYVVFGTLLDLQIEGRENVPKDGPLLVVCNHFNGLDAALVVRVAPWLLEFLADFEMPNVPGWMKFITDVWGTFPVNEANTSRFALRAAEATLAQDGVVMVFPEGRLGEPVLRSPKPGVAFLAVRSGAPVLPMAIIGSTEVFAAWREFKRPRVIVRFGEPIGPFTAEGKGRERRMQLEEVSEQIMRAIARLLPEERRGYLRGKV